MIVIVTSLKTLALVACRFLAAWAISERKNIAGHPMPGMIGPLVHLSSRPDLEVTRIADALPDVLRAGS